MEEEKIITCKSCQHFMQHYILCEDGQYHKVNCGHCNTRRLRHRNPNNEACIYWIACQEN